MTQSIEILAGENVNNSNTDLQETFKYLGEYLPWFLG